MVEFRRPTNVIGSRLPVRDSASKRALILLQKMMGVYMFA
jgi:hypothetical protein